MTGKHFLRLIARRFGVEVARRSVHNSTDLRIVKLLATHGVDTVVDVGANAGSYAESLFSNGYNGRVVSFEPLEAAHATLSQRATSHPGWAVAERTALGSEDGEVVINVAANSASSSIFPMLASHVSAHPESRYIGNQRVRMQRLDNVRQEWIDDSESLFLKVDTQGYEQAVLQGATGLLGRLKGVQLEMSLVPLYEGQMLFAGLCDMLCGWGFELYSLEPGFIDARTGRMLQVDGVFFRSIDA